MFAFITGEKQKSHRKAEQDTNNNNNIDDDRNSSIQSDKSSNSNGHDNALGDNNKKSEKLDLADLDLSQLRLSKRDLKTLSSITPELPKHCQEQLLAQLPPTQARKLYRTLSMQTTNAPHVYKRSISSGNDSADKKQFEDTLESPTAFDRNSILRRSLSRGRELSKKRHESSNVVTRPNSIARCLYAGERNSLNPCDQLTSQYRLNDYSACIPNEHYSRLQSPINNGDNMETPVHKQSPQRRTSRFLRPDFYGNSSNIALPLINVIKFSPDKCERERETQEVLKKIRERGRSQQGNRDASPFVESQQLNTLTKSNGVSDDPNSDCTPNIRLTVNKKTGEILGSRNRNVEAHCSTVDDPYKQARRSSLTASGANKMSSLPHAISEPNGEKNLRVSTDYILNELVKQSQTEVSNGTDNNATEKQSEIKTPNNVSPYAINSFICF